MKVGLKAKVTIFVSLLVVAVISINAVITIRTERKERERQLLEQGRLFARLTATEVVRSYGSLSWGGGGGAPNVQVSKFFRYYPDLSRLSIISQSGMVLYDSGSGRPGPGQERVTDPEIMKRLNSPEMDVRQFTGEDGQTYMDIIAPVTETGGPQFLKVRYIISFRSLEERLSAIRVEFLLLAGFFIAVGIIGATFFSMRLTMPILKLKDGAGEIARGNLEHLVEVSAKDEIGELGRSFNRMALSLKEHRKELEEANASLKNRNDELKELHKELIRSERMAAVGELAAGLSHEIDNPIGVILGFAELLLEDMPEDDPRREDLVTILEESKRCKRIVRGLLDFSRPPVLGVVPTQINEVIRRTVDAARSQRIFKAVKVALNLSPDIPEIAADPDRLRQVFMNLLLNAVQAMPAGGRIEVTTGYDKEGGLIKAAFRDTGMGIPQEDQKKVFEPFFTTKRPGEGTGLGLAICERLLEEHGGTVEVSSEPGKGAVFTVKLPAAVPGINPEKA